MSSCAPNNFVINIATVNGSGSQTANSVLLRTLFRLGIPVGGKNVFPSNISGMPTWFWIRAHPKGYVGAVDKADILVGLNPQTLKEDQEYLSEGGVLIYPENLKNLKIEFRKDIRLLSIPLQKLTEQIQAPLKIKKLASNMIYVGILASLLGIPVEEVKKTIVDQIGNKPSALAANIEAFAVGHEYAEKEMTDQPLGICVSPQSRPVDKILMDGNTAAALGLISGGCQFISWYPITPSTSLVEAFAKFAEKTRKDIDKKNKFAIVQAEDELSAFSMVLGAGWAGTRALTATSGPGLSLMAEGAGYAYYAEIPSVIWNVQRLGPSTGLPTRTAQGDVGFAANLSHGDTQHVLLFPGTILECFEFGQVCFDLAERLQTLVVVLSDLDLGMNLWSSEVLRPLEKKYDRGLILDAVALEEKNTYYRYDDQYSDGVSPRTLPGNESCKAAYFTRGSGHNTKGQYTEKPLEYIQNIQRLKKKWETAKGLVPGPVIEGRQSPLGLIYYGSTTAIMEELRDLYQNPLSLCRIKAYPFSKEVEEFIQTNEKIYVIEQNRDGQLKNLLIQEFPKLAGKIRSILHWEGTPITAQKIHLALKEQGGL